MIPFAPWLPDIAAFQTDASREALNVVPSSSGFRPFSALSTVTAALTARCQGAVSLKNLSGTIFNFAGDATKLYKMATGGLTWDDVSRSSGGAYATPADGRWTFSQYGNFVVAVNGADVPQVFEMGTSTEFAALGGTPPTAYYTGTIREFSILARTATENNRIKWSAIGDVEDWVTSATTLSDAQDFPEGGLIMGFVGGEYGLVFQERAIQRMSFEGPPTAFRFDKLTNLLGCRAEGSIAAFENFVFFLGDDGFYMIRGGAEIIPIGVEKVDRWTENNLDAAQLARVTSAIDPINKLYVIGFPTVGAANPDVILIYHWPTGQWSRAAVEHDWLYASMTQAGYTIDDMGLVAATIDELPYPTDSRFWSGSGRLLLSGFDTAKKQGFFSGNNLEAKVETGDNQLTPGGRSLFRGLRPMIEGTSVMPIMEVGYRNQLDEAVAYTSPSTANAYGFCNARINARYHRARITIPAGSAWEFARGVDDIKFSPMGRR
jgi:hypothetical protein